MKKEYKYHYVYRITNIITEYYYYGSKSCNENPIENIGVEYFSTSTNKLFIQDQKNNPNDYKYKVIKIFETCRDDATDFEVQLHSKFDVRNHPKFINRANQTSKKFMNNYEIRAKSVSTMKNNGWYKKLSKQQSNLQKEIQTNGKTKAQNSREKQYRKQLLDIDDNGLNAAQRATLKYHENLKNTVDKQTGLTKAELRIQRQKETIKLKGSHSGENNSAFGFRWIYNDELKESKRVLESELEFYYSSGWLKGMKREYCKNKR